MRDAPPTPPTTRGPLYDITIRYHAAMPNWCKLNGLEIKAVHPSEGGGFMVRRDQAEAIIALWNAGMKHAMDIVLSCPDGTPPVEVFRAIQKELS